MGKMDLHPVTIIEDEFLENILMNVEVTKNSRVRVGIAQLLTVIGDMDWDEAEDTDIQDAIRKLDKWEGDTGCSFGT